MGRCVAIVGSIATIAATPALHDYFGKVGTNFALTIVILLLNFASFMTGYSLTTPFDPYKRANPIRYTLASWFVMLVVGFVCAANANGRHRFG